ncbi:hypothetical protein D3M71_15895 [Erwinia billingiae]|nr:hypothetical protein [Erwinia billingiae]
MVHHQRLGQKALAGITVARAIVALIREIQKTIRPIIPSPMPEQEEMPRRGKMRPDVRQKKRPEKSRKTWRGSVSRKPQKKQAMKKKR